MIVSELVEVLRFMPQDANIFYCWDGEARSPLDVVYESRKGDVIFADDIIDLPRTDEDLPKTNKVWKSDT